MTGNQVLFITVYFSNSQNVAFFILVRYGCIPMGHLQILCETWICFYVTPNTL